MSILKIICSFINFSLLYISTKCVLVTKPSLGYEYFYLYVYTFRLELLEFVIQYIRSDYNSNQIYYSLLFQFNVHFVQYQHNGHERPDKSNSPYFQVYITKYLSLQHVFFDLLTLFPRNRLIPTFFPIKIDYLTETEFLCCNTMIFDKTNF